MKATSVLTRNAVESEKQFRHAVFNVFAHNRDDHAKNFSYLMDGKGVWTVSPAYDLTLSNGPGGEHCTTVMGNGRSPGTEDLMKLATISDIDQKNAREIIQQVRDAIGRWLDFAKEASVGYDSTVSIQRLLASIR